ncbi:diaminohydroxyphosphoribosylaminopyrimidine deaminase 5-amino-6-(5-phosphoribosylamino)uracil reductase [Agrilactobacillus composti DSM 18527 = JCM 14202]|uniref:Riboflavin biosynthesis protein RibD n=1 Tax=Agrilactobacillus composti DSM 18527 = JCM 14202 TaxID=1423734 RepID=X0QT04_9LACO|nr:bifunctional diaminohydroxyphosphoribosylaminopyrimidine deaminase/5-amino-6-(5-phosphoribosylamino)uracil reductase RibD [Agrilactobacillus composti]KRM30874.1 diaminohydroxyphosphoribosylaminopyrimidine deaminase 5-amino-6-(5-phosphoribosylamino)uracil reductase [Agrilactobacillus composti DSM 18527 = JCM 14202]GAF41750.1 diaminohydroxyphosphoribosylaminopyrimidine deaminase [Agrilactobacillus composti DSM 18527 = JCM 14202]
MTDFEYMALAYQQAAKGQGLTWTNPCVGAILVKQGHLLAMGYHHSFGQPHAEVDALQHLADPKAAKGATMYVTLEPCSHFGKTPPCAKKLVAVGIKRVVIGQQDPNPLVSGKGIAILKAAGIQVTVLQYPDQLNTTYHFFYRHQRPLITLKYAMSLDGKINGAPNQRTILTGQAAYQDSQQLRAAHQAILIGENTLTVDNPALTVRHVKTAHPPIRIILVRQADTLSHDLQLFQTKIPIWLLASQPSRQDWPDHVSVFQDDHWTPQAIMAFLYRQGVQSLLVEGGSQIQAAFTAANLNDCLVVYLAPLMLGGGGLPAVFGTSQTQHTPFQITTRQLDSDIRIDARRNF